MKNQIEDAFIYHIYTLGFCGAPLANTHNKIEERLHKIQHIIPHIKKLGINAVFLGPLFESATHGYDTVDYFTVDKRLGTNASLKELVQELHKNGINVILDTVFNHASRAFFAFRDLKEKKEHSIYKNWFSNVDFGRNNPMQDGFAYDCWEGHWELVKFNHFNDAVKEYLFSAVKYWINEFAIDGIRLDAADVMDLGFLNSLSTYCRAVKNDLWIMGEVIHGDYSRWIDYGKLDSVTNYECYKGLWSSFNEKNLFEINYSLNRLFGDNGMVKNLKLYNFLDNHDVDRISEKLKDENCIYPLYGLLFSIPGIPSVYYGSELFINGKKTHNSDAGLRPEINMDKLFALTRHKNLVNDIARFAGLRKKHKALRNGNYRTVFVSGEQLVFSRSFMDETLLVAVNSAEQVKQVELKGIYKQDGYDLLNHENVRLDKLSIPGYWLRIIKI